MSLFGSGPESCSHACAEEPDSVIPDGHIHEEVSASSPVAQKYYDQGLLLLYAYDWINAARSFSEALRRDPHLALADLGLSFAYTGLGDVGVHTAS